MAMNATRPEGLRGAARTRQVLTTMPFVEDKAWVLPLADWRRMLRNGAIGLGFALLLALVSVPMAGAGHGWPLPLVYSICGLVLIPWSGIALRVRRSASRTRNFTYLALVLIPLDLLLLLNFTTDSVSEMNEQVHGLYWLWLGPWLAWSLFVVICLVRAWAHRVRIHFQDQK